MRAWWRAVTVGALLVAGLPFASHATPLDDGPVLVVTGNGPAVVTFTVRSALQFDPSDAEISMGLGATYGGVLFIRTKDDAIYGGAYRFRSLDAYEVPGSPVTPGRPHTVQPPGGPRGSMPPGTYRAHLLGDGEVEVSLPLTRGASLTLRPTAPSRQRAHVTQHVVAADTDDDVETVTLRHELTRPNRAFSAVVGKVTGPGVLTGSTLRACFMKRPAKCDHGVWYGRRDVLALNGSTSVATAMRREYTRSNAGRYYATVDLGSEQSAQATLWLAFLQVDY